MLISAQRTKKIVDKETALLLRFLKVIQILFLLQITFGVIIPCIDTFLDLGTDFHSFLDRFYSIASSRTRKSNANFKHNNTICVPGAGFSGFWLTLGMLHARETHDFHLEVTINKGIGKQLFHDSPDATLSKLDLDDPNTMKCSHEALDFPNKFEYECFSAGCLAVVSTLFNHTVENVMEIAEEAQILWHQGKISRYEVVEHFIGGLLRISTREMKMPTSSMNNTLSRIHVITTGLNWDDPRYGYLKYYSRSPTTIQELKELLIQTTWM